MEDPISNPEAIAEAKRIANAPEAAQLKALLQQQNAKGLRPGHGASRPGGPIRGSKHHQRLSRHPRGERVAGATEEKPMSEVEDQLGAILGNPKMMADIMALAQSMGQEESPQVPEKPSGSPPLPSSLGDGGMDMAMVKALTSFTGVPALKRNSRPF